MDPSGRALASAFDDVPGSGRKGDEVAVRRIGPWYRLAVIVLKPLLKALTRRNWQGAENLPATGGFVVVVNHISHLDPFTFGHFMYDNGYLPRFLTKEVGNEYSQEPILGSERAADDY